MSAPDLEEAVQAAEEAVRAIEREISAEIDAACAAIRAKHKATLDAACRARSQAVEAKNAAAISEGAASPLVGKKVRREVNRWRGPIWSSRRETVEEFGIVEVFTRESRMAEKLSRYGRPQLGTLIVRILKKDGTPGLKFERLTEQWKPVQ